MKYLTPYEQAKLVYRREWSKRTFHEDLFWHYAHGYVINCPEFFVMARVVPSQMSLGLLVDPTINWQDGDTWWIHCFSGKIEKLFTWAPFELPLVGWEKRNKPRIYHLITIKQRFLNAQSIPQS